MKYYLVFLTTLKDSVEWVGPVLPVTVAGYVGLKLAEPYLASKVSGMCDPIRSCMEAGAHRTAECGRFSAAAPPSPNFRSVLAGVREIRGKTCPPSLPGPLFTAALFVGRAPICWIITYG